MNHWYRSTIGSWKQNLNKANKTDMVHRILSGSSTEPYLVLQLQHDEYIEDRCIQQPILNDSHFFLNSRPPFKKIKYWTTNTRIVKAWKDITHEFQHSCIVEFSTRPRFDSDGEPPLSLIRIVDCMVWPYCRSRPPCGNMAAVSLCSWLCWFGDGLNETLDGSMIEEPIKNICETQIILK